MSENSSEKPVKLTGLPSGWSVETAVNAFTDNGDGSVTVEMGVIFGDPNGVLYEGVRKIRIYKPSNKSKTKAESKEAEATAEASGLTSVHD